MGSLIKKTQWGYEIFDGVFETEWGCSGVGEKSVGLPHKSFGFTFNGLLQGGTN